jgi:hypothetical protein
LLLLEILKRGEKTVYATANLVGPLFALSNGDVESPAI